MIKYNPKKFIDALNSKINGRKIPNCPFCGGSKFTSTDKFASIFIGDDLNSITIGTTVPSGMIICEKCGHIEFFALGSLGLLARKEENEDGE